MDLKSISENVDVNPILLLFIGVGLFCLPEVFAVFREMPTLKALCLTVFGGALVGIGIVKLLAKKNCRRA